MRVSRVLGGAALAAAVGATSAGLLTATGGHESAVRPKADRLVRFDSCDTLRTYASRRATALLSTAGYGPYGVRWISGGPVFRESMPLDATRAVPVTAPATGAAPAADQAGSAAPAADHSGTNLQEAGVDEPDIVVSDGRHVFTTSGGALRILAAGDTPAPVGALRLADLGDGAQLLKVGDRLLVISADVGYTTSPAADVAVAPTTGRRSGMTTTATPRTVVRLVDVADPAAPRLVETLRVDGTLLGARRPAGGAVRLVMQSSPDPVPMYGVGSPQARTWHQAAVRNAATLRRQPARTWLPAMQLTQAGKKPVRRTAVGCRDVARATQFAGLNTLVVLTIDPAAGLTPVDRDAVMTDGQIVYGSATGLYVTTPHWVDPSSAAAARTAGGARTQIHRFDISAPASTGYAASGSVPGYLLNQFSLSEHEGVLRVASTNEPQWAAATAAAQSESQVTTLAQEGRRLVERGRLTGLGVDERIYGVRFLGDQGYVVTFRQMDPLYVIDLSDPARPVKRGELKIPGYSAYLHPVGEGLLLGVGQNATDQGRPVGTQISLFDVSNPAAPRRVQNLTLPDGWSEAENDHHAFLYWAPTGLAMVPVNTHVAGTPRSEAVGVRVTRDGITRIRSVSHPRTAATTPTIRRAMVIGERVFTLSDAGLQAVRLDNLAPLGYTAFG